VVRGAVAQVVLVAQPAFDLDQIFDVHARGECLVTESALGLLATRARIFVEQHAELSRPLENMEKLAERHPQQRADDGHGMRDRNELVRVAVEPFVAHHQHQPGHADGEQQNQR